MCCRRLLLRRKKNILCLVESWRSVLKQEKVRNKIKMDPDEYLCLKIVGYANVIFQFLPSLILFVSDSKSNYGSEHHLLRSEHQQSMYMMILSPKIEYAYVINFSVGFILFLGIYHVSVNLSGKCHDLI